MENLTQAIVFLSIAAFVFPIVGIVWIHMRTESMRIDATLAVKEASSSSADIIALRETVVLMDNKHRDVLTNIHELRAAIRSFEESIRTINNKLASRDRADRRAAAEVQKPEPAEEVNDQIAVDQQVIDFPGFGGEPNPQPAAVMPRKRKFGEQP